VNTIKVLIGMGHRTQETEAILKDAPEAVQIDFLPPGATLSDHIADVEVLYGPIEAADLPKANALKWVQLHSTGADNMMYPAFQARDIALTTIRGVLTIPVAEHALALVLTLTRRIFVLLDQMREKHWQPVPGTNLAELTMGIIGFGEIGRAIAERASGFGMNIIAVDPNSTEKPGFVQHLGQINGLPELLAQSDVIVVSCPSTPQTRKMLSHKQFAQMRDGAYVVNISRGDIVDEDALLTALRSGKLAGAGIDVTDPEPYPVDGPLWTEPNVVLTSHSAGHCQNLEQRKKRRLVENLHRYVSGQPLLGLVDKQLGY
jgi:phosphoglycerate dehydrogenase-like enzyme